MAASLSLRGVITGHSGWVTSLATTEGNPNLLISASRDKKALVWDITRQEITSYAQPKRSLVGHSHVVSDVVMSSDGQFALTGSWDHSLRLWELATGKVVKQFVSHTKDVTTVAFRFDNRHILSGGRDRSLRLWNTIGECKHSFDKDAHTEWVSCVRFSPAGQDPVAVSCGWDKVVKVWDVAKCKLSTNLVGHTGYLNAVTVSPDGSLCASGGKDGTAKLWDLAAGSELYSLPDAGGMINALAFSPNRYWLCAATQNGVKIFDLESKDCVADLDKTHPDFFAGRPAGTTPNPAAISLAWSSDGTSLYVGYTDNTIRVYVVQ